MDLFYLSDDKKIGFLIAQKEFFESDCVFRTAGMYLDKFFVTFYPYDELSIRIEIRGKKGEEITEDLLKTFMNDLIDNQIRLDVEREFSSIRDKIVSQAFLSAKGNREN